MTKLVKALTIHSPWAQAIMDQSPNSKNVENRDWETSYRGDVLIHVGKSRKSMTPEVLRTIARRGVELPKPMLLGFILGVVRLSGCVAAHSPDGLALRRNNHWCDEEAEYYWIFRDPRSLAKPVPCVGMLGLFTVPEPAASEVMRQLTICTEA